MRVLWLLYCFFALILFFFGLSLSFAAGILVAFTAFLGAVFLTFFLRLRKRKLKELAVDMDRLLHGDYQVRFKNYEEGETAIVANELAKITDTLQTQAEKLKNEKKDLADSIADISHQIRTPLTALTLTLETMNGKEEALKAKQLTRRIEWLIEALLKLSKLDAGTVKFQREKVLVCQAVREAAAPFEILMDLRAQTMDTSKISPDASFFGDLSWSAEALANILKNCIEHTGEGGKIWISAQENAIYTEIVLEDNGEGIAKEDLPHLFERFYKGKNSGGNSVGIGLALTRAILTAQNGTVFAENRREGGARFVLRIYKGIV